MATQFGTEDRQPLRESIRGICQQFDGAYWQRLEQTGEYPNEFIKELTEAGWLAILIPEEYGGGGGSILDAGTVLEEIHRSGANANACHAQMYTMGVILKHGSEEQRRRYLPRIASGEMRLQAFAVTEAEAGSDTTQIATRAVRDGRRFIVNGQKTYISRVAYSDLMVLLARTEAADEVSSRTEGLSVFLVDLEEAGDSVSYSRIPLMFNHHTYQVFINDLVLDESALVGKEGQGFRHILDGLNAERILISSEALGDARFFIERATQYAKQRTVFGRNLGANQGIQFPISQAFAATEAATLMRDYAGSLFEAGQPCGPQANMAKLLSSQASWSAANAAVSTLGGNAFAAEYDVERKFRETKLLEIAPVSNNLVLAYLAQRVLGLERAY